MADKNTKPIEDTPVQPKPAAPVVGQERVAALAALWNCSIEEATKREAERLAKKQ